MHLETRLKARYRLKDTVIPFGDKTLSVLSVANIDELLDQVTYEDEIPFWAELWPASVGLLKVFEAGPQLDGQTVLEIGCGTGLAGLGVLLRGGCLTQTDYAVEALQFATVNAVRNGLSPAQCVQADWRNFKLQQKYDWIIGSDILYEKKLHSSLMEIFTRNLAANGKVLLTDPGRLYAREFVQTMEATGWTVQTNYTAIDFEAKTTQIVVYAAVGSCFPQEEHGWDKTGKDA